MYCASHAKRATADYNERKGTPAERGYDWNWQKVRRMILRRQPICATPGCGQAATDVHHIKALAQGGENSEENLQGLCHACHSRITVKENGGFGYERKDKQKTN